MEIATTESTTYQDAALTSLTTYSYSVSAVDAGGNESLKSTAVTVDTSPIEVINNPPVLGSLSDIIGNGERCSNV